MGGIFLNRVIGVRKFRAYSLGVSRENKAIKTVRARKYIRIKGGVKKKKNRKSQFFLEIVDVLLFLPFVKVWVNALATELKYYSCFGRSPRNCGFARNPPR